MSPVQKKIRVVIADDSALMRKILSDIVNGDSDMEVIATARNGQEALEKVLSLAPDVLTLDIEMPVMDGLTTLDKVMQLHPIPVIVLSALTQSGAETTMTALDRGALDFVAKPSGSISLDIGKIALELKDKIKAVSGARVFKKIPQFTELRDAVITKVKAPSEQIVMGPHFPLVFIGTSTGGPKALHEVMAHLPSGLHTAIFIVQHMPPGFTKSMAQRLDAVSPFSVKEAEDGDEVKPGYAYVAPGDFHMELKCTAHKIHIVLNQENPVNGHRPAVDVLFHSGAKFTGPKIAVIMTGMGNDGAKGLLALKKKGARTIGESMETCVVYGMPKTAMQLGAVEQEVPLSKIAQAIVDALKKAK